MITALALAVAQNTAPPAPMVYTPAAPEQVALLNASTLGRSIYDHDQAAWHTTDALRRALPNPRKAGIAGYFVEPVGEGLRVTYYGKAGKTNVPIYVADYSGGRVVNGRVVPQAERRPITASQSRLIDVVAMAQRVKLHRCSPGPMNSVVLTAPAEPYVYVEVYLLTPQPASDAYAFGGHNRISFALNRITGTRTFAKSCLTMSAPPGADASGAMVVTHLLDPIPTEIHVFNSLASRRPIYVSVADGRLWKVDGAKIDLVRQPAPKPR